MLASLSLVPQPKKIAIISDIHSNLEALTRVIEDARYNQTTVNEICCLGDIVGYGPAPLQCVSEVFLYCSQGAIIRGNHEECVMDFERLKDELNPFAKAGIVYTRSELLKSDRIDEKFHIFRNLPTRKSLTRFDITLAHGSYTEPSAWKYIYDEEAVAKEAEASPTHVLFLGHTHVPFVYSNVNGLYEGPFEEFVLPKDEKFVINVGSVGQPRDGDCRSAYGILEIKDNGEKTYTLRRVFYDIQKTADAIMKAGLPIELAERLFRGE